MAIKRTKLLIKEYPSHTVLLSIILTICAGTLLLALPICRHKYIDWIDLFFTSTSMTTVSGLRTVPLSDFTSYGQWVILFLMQIGGLGLMTMSLFVVSFFVDLGLYTQILASEMLSIKEFKDTKRILLFIIKFTFISEFIGALFTFLIIRHDYECNRAIFLSIFHAISSFCNVGISLFNHETFSYNTNIRMLITTTLLILFGSLGFVTWHEISKNIKRRKNILKFSWHTKIVLKVFFITSLISGILLWLLERHNTLGNMNRVQTFFNILLLSISTKSSGYLPVNIELMQPATILLLMIVAFIGAAPSSTGGGIKTNTFAIFFIIMRSTLNGRSHAEMCGRTITKDQVYKAMAIIAIAACWIITTTFCLLITENHDSMDVLLETVSAFSNNGLSLGITPLLSMIGKISIIITMIVGRIGALALIIGMRRSSDLAEFSYPEERIILG